ncbi:MAG: hypothetical protein WC346_00430 [Methanogenium sp.]|jgi:hypothetical protein
MSQTFQFIVARAKEHPQIIRRSQMSKQAFFSSRATSEKEMACSNEAISQPPHPIISA